MGLDLYYIPLSPPSTAVRLLAKALGVELNLKMVDMQSGAHMKPEFLKMNPQHTVPTLDDNGLYLSESRPIMVYLCEEYGKDDSLFPKCPKKRALINQRLYFDAGTLYQRFLEIYVPVAFMGVTEASEDKKSRLREALNWLDGFLCDGHVVGDSMTVADYSVMASVVSMEAVGFDLSSYKNISCWMSKCKQSMPGFAEINHAAMFGEFVGSKIKAAGITL